MECPTQKRTRSHNIISCLPGDKSHAKNAKSPLERLKLFISPNITDLILKYTNQKIESEKDDSVYHAKMDENELNALVGFGLLMIAGVYKSSHQNIRDLWNKDGFGVDIFRYTMNINRFQFLLKVLRFDDMNTRNTRKALDKATHIREIFDIFNDNCNNSYSVGQYVTIDEMLPAFKGKCPLRQYMPNKPSKYGLKIYALVYSRTFYTLKTELYTGNQPEGPYKLSNKPFDVVERLIQPILKSMELITPFMTNRYENPRINRLLRNNIGDVLNIIDEKHIPINKKGRCYVCPRVKDKKQH
ncbi:piggyBac transposable element-derived protein 4-like [Gordionus sp. m RMFG-2023]|uniref:piggyBac transposable element-derived protein 4-like n=1 Tax=Gordionus sp. m RMFG-2023 TaxID=3053472 RepID=UPI0031FDD1B3